MDLIAQANKSLPCHLRWTCDNVKTEWPEPDLKYAFEGFEARTYIEATLLIMHYPGLYDGGVEFLCERTLEPAMKLLFSSSRISFLS